MSDAAPGELAQPELISVPLFPLPNVVLLPRAVLPLHIFEERYKAMTVDALAGARLVAMALLRPGWEKCYYGAPPIEPVVCVGQILSHEKLPDGNFNFLLQGWLRARVLQEDRSHPYRLARLEPLREQAVLEIDLDNERQRLGRMLSDGDYCEMPIVRQFRKMIASPMPTAEIADLLAFTFLDDISLKQSLLAETDVRRRVERVLVALDEARWRLESGMRRRGRGCQSPN